MSTTEIANGLVALCKKGDFMSAMDAYYSDDIVSVEPMGDEPESKGLAAVKGKAEWWSNNFEVHSVEIDGPFVFGEKFIVRFKLDVTHKPSGKRDIMDEAGLYKVSGEKIVHEAFFYAPK